MGTEQEERLTQQVDILRELEVDYVIQCASIKKLVELQKAGYHVYLPFPVTDWETYQGLREREVSDVLIDGPLGFQWKKLADSKGDIKLRVVPHTSPNSAVSASTVSKFFIRPEDLQTYSALDIVELSSSSIGREDALFSIYHRGSFDFNLGELVEDFPYEVNNRYVKSDFAQQRLNCGQRCKIPGHSCHYCDNYFRAIKNS